ncbi:MAG: hypothetical protein D6685_09705, partial [Bacteroidetes bacterium]
MDRTGRAKHPKSPPQKQLSTFSFQPSAVSYQPAARSPQPAAHSQKPEARSPKPDVTRRCRRAVGSCGAMPCI